jgi:hypothetical protein
MIRRLLPNPRWLARAVLAGCFCVLGAASAWAESIVVGPDGVPSTLRDAARLAKDGDTIEVLPGDYRGQVAVLQQKKLTIRGLGKRPVFHADGKTAESKAILVVREGEVLIENIEFRGARANDANGAGVRFEKGRLTVKDCSFVDNENGILTGNEAGAELVIQNSVFSDAPRVVGGLAHLLYVGRIASLSVSGSRFHRGFEGHLLKSRARENRITANFIVDGDTGGASYEIDLPNGGRAWIVGNVIAQSPRSQNRVLVAYGAEGRPWPDNALYMAHNTLINGGWRPAWFLRVFRDRLPDATEVHAINNLTVGAGVFDWGAPGHFAGNQHVLGNGALSDPEMLGFEPTAASGLRGSGVDPRNVAGQNLAPKLEFSLPIGTRPAPALPGWTPGAFQR